VVEVAEMMPSAVELEIDEACTEFVMAIEHRFFKERLMDTLYFRQALEEYALKTSAQIKVGDLTVGQLSWLLRRAQELKAADTTFLQGKPQPIVAALDDER
jgi:hypothetical protein